MARIVPWPIGLIPLTTTPLEAPQTLNSGQSRGFNGYHQTYSGIGFLWQFEFTFQNMRGALARDFEGWLYAQHSGANATIFNFCNRAQQSLRELGYLDFPRSRSWSNSLPWSDTQQNWSASWPQVEIVLSATEGSVFVTIANDKWGHKLKRGAWLGFMPFHLGIYRVTEVLGDGKYRIFPPLRKGVERGDFATLNPSIALRMNGQEAYSGIRGPVWLESPTFKAVEVLDYDVRSHFTNTV